MEQGAIKAVLVHQDGDPACAARGPSRVCPCSAGGGRLSKRESTLRTVALNEGSYPPEGVNRFMVRRTIKSLLVGILPAINRVSAVNARGSSRCGMFSWVR